MNPKLDHEFIPHAEEEMEATRRWLQSDQAHELARQMLHTQSDVNRRDEERTRLELLANS